jgi:hypothetical protein
MLRAISELLKIYEAEVRARIELRDRCQDTLRKRLAQQIAQIADVPRWAALATSDPKKFRSQREAALREYKKTLNSFCGIQSHRPKNEAQLLLISTITMTHPDWSFGQVAREYTRRSGKPMTAKIAERTYARAERDDGLFLEGDTALLLYLKSLQNTTKA